MSKKPEFDEAAAHKFYSAQCFNRAWDLIGKKDRTAEENEEMINLGQASVWHWKQRPDCTKTNLSIGYWQVSRIYSLLGQAENAKRYGHLCRESGQDAGPFYLGFAYEALARAESVGGNKNKMQEYLDEANRLAASIPNKDERDILTNDLRTIIG